MGQDESKALFGKPREEIELFFEWKTERPCEAETVRRAMNGDKDAFSILFMNTYRPMYYVAKRILRKDEDIYDALQMGYMKAYKYIARLSSVEMFFPWLKKTMENAALDVYADMDDPYRRSHPGLHRTAGGTLHLLNTDTLEITQTDFRLKDKITTGSKGFGYYTFEAGWVWGIASSGAWARLCYTGSGYTEYS